MIKKEELKDYCFICGDVKSARLAYKKDNITIIRCYECDTLFRPNDEHGNFDAKDNAFEYYSEGIRCTLGNKLFFKLVFKDLIKKFPNIKGGNFLDFGCGVGNSLLEADAMGFNVFGSDVSRYAIDFCNKLGFKVFKSIEDINTEQIKFDLINLHHVLEHIADPIKFLIQIKNLLNKDGILRIEVPNSQNLFFWNFFINCKYVVAHPSVDHLYYYTDNTLEHIIVKANLEIFDIHTEGFASTARHKATMLNPEICIRALSIFLYFTKIEKITNLESFLVAIVKKTTDL